MMELFENPILLNKKISDPKLENTLFVLAIDIDNIISYEFNTNNYLKRPNKLINLLTSIDINLIDDLDVYDIIRKIVNTSIYVSKDIDMVSDRNYGKIINSNIVPDCKEIYVYVDNIDITKMDENNYLNYEPIRCIYSNKSNIQLFHPTRYIDTTDLNLFIYEVDVNALAMQYYYWAKDQIRIDRDIDIARYLYTIPLTYLIKSMNDINILNRFINLYLENDNDIVYYNSPISTYKHIDKRLDKDYIRYIKTLSKYKNEYYSTILDNIPLPYSNGLDALMIKFNTFTIQTQWVLWLSRIDYIINIIDMLGTEGMKRNSMLITHLNKEIKEAERNKVFDRINDEYFYIDFMSKLNILKEKINYKG